MKNADELIKEARRNDYEGRRDYGQGLLEAILRTLVEIRDNTQPVTYNVVNAGPAPVIKFCDGDEGCALQPRRFCEGDDGDCMKPVEGPTSLCRDHLVKQTAKKIADMAGPYWDYTMGN